MKVKQKTKKRRLQQRITTRVLCMLLILIIAFESDSTYVLAAEVGDTQEGTVQETGETTETASSTDKTDTVGTTDTTETTDTTGTEGTTAEETETTTGIDTQTDTGAQVETQAVTKEADIGILTEDGTNLKDVNNETATSVKLNSTTFPDDIFRKYITDTYDKDRNGELSETEIKSADNVRVTSLGIKTVKGIEYLSGLLYLRVTNNNIDNLDISSNKKLQVLECSANNLTNLDISANAELKYVELVENSITSLNLANNSKIEGLYCNKNNLTSLDVSTLIELDHLDVGHNNLTELNISKNLKLKDLCINGTKITKMDFSNNLNLTDFACTYTDMTSLDLRNNNLMGSLICQDSDIATIQWGDMSNYWFLNLKSTQIDNLDVTKCPLLSSLYCDNDHITKLDVTKCPKLLILCCSNNNLTELDVSNNPLLNKLQCSNNKISKLILPNQKQLYDLYCDSNNLVALDLSNTDVVRGDYRYNKRELSADKDGYVDLSVLEADGFDITKASNWSSNVAVDKATKKMKVDFSSSTNIPKQVEVTYHYAVNNTFVGDQEFVLKITQYRTNIADVQIQMYDSDIYWGLGIEGIKKITYNGKELVHGREYVVEGNGNNINVGTATVTIKGINEFTGSLTKTFQILPAPISKVVLGNIADQTYTGLSITPDVPLKLKSLDEYMVKDRDYTLSYANNTAAGTATVTITGKGNYTGEATTSFKINPIDITTGRIDEIQEKSYLGSEIKPGTIVFVNNTTLVNGTDYDLRYSNNVNPGTATVTIVGKGNYTGEVTKNFKINPNDIAAGRIEDIPTQAYTGSEVKPGINVVVNNTTLVNGTDYDLSYSNNINIGTATVTATGKGKYTGSISKTYNISIATVGNLRNTKSKTTSIKLKWDKTSGVNGYEIYSCKTGSKKYKKLTTIKKASTTTYTNKKLKIGTAYSYKIRAYKTVNGKKQYGEYTVLNTTTSMSKPVVKMSAGSKKATISYQKVSGANGYEIYMSTSKKGTYEKVKTLTKASKIKYTKKGLKKKKTYYFKVRAYKNVNGEKVYSSYSTVKKIKVK